ncbi:MAG: DUF475 domain-containing protein [Candidatus Gastranaerophilales bacterium]|nr:DUF475 domain-containing protein [Candidatus Gastranaerophilales bacterium]
MKHFRGSFIFTLIGMVLAFLWAHKTVPGHELSSLFVIAVLSILEVSLSFDNAVVNALKLEKMPPVWQHRFLTWGIWIAVFGMRFLFPLLVVSIFAKLNLFEVLNMAIQAPDKYTHYLEITHPMVITFGAAFLMTLFFTYFINSDKEVHWLKPIETRLCKLSEISGLNIILTLGLIFFFNQFISYEYRYDALIAGVWGIIVFVAIEFLSKMLEGNENKALNLEHFGLVNFLYLELIDVSFSLDGVLGAFALSRDIIIITIGLSVGAMFVRSMTIMLVEKKTLKQFPYLEHGAHWAIGTLALIMFISSFHEVSEIITGLSGLLFIISSLVCSMLKNNKNA